MSKTNMAKLTSPLPAARINQYNNPVAFDTYVANSAAPSQNEDTRLIVKKDESYGPGHRVAYIGFNAERYNIPDIIDSLALRLHVTENDREGMVNVYFVSDDSFWNTTFRYKNRPQESTLITSFSTGNANSDGWLTIDITHPDLLAKFRLDGNVSIALMGGDSLFFHEFSSSREKDYAPSLQLATCTKAITPSNKVRYVSVAITGIENNSKLAKVSEINVINAEGKLEDRKKWIVIKGSNLTAWENMFDGSQDTHWRVNSPAPIYFIIDLGNEIDIKALVYTPQKNGHDGRAADILIFGSDDGSVWRLIGSRAIKHGDGNAPHIIFTGNEAALNQVEKSYSYPVKTGWTIEQKRLKNKRGKSPLNITELYFNEPGVVCIWIGDTHASAGDYLEAHEGYLASSQRHLLQYGLNSFYCGVGNPLYLRISSNSSSDNSRTASVIIMASSALYYPVFRSRATSQAEWLSMINTYTYVNYYEMKTDRVILGLFREQFEPYKNQINMQELSSAYDEYVTPTELAAGIRLNDENPMHRPDVNLYHYTPSYTGYMSAINHRIKYHIDLTKRMVTPDEVRSFWGIWHEMGHVLQTSGLNWSGQNEASANIYAFASRAYRLPLSTLVASYDPSFQKTYNALEKAESYSELSSEFKDILFHHLFFIFGETFAHALHRRYRENMNGAINDPEFKIGSTEDEQMNVMAMICSKIVEVDLVDFFRFWKFKLTDETIATIKNYNFEGVSDFDKLPSELVQRKPEDSYDMRF